MPELSCDLYGKEAVVKKKIVLFFIFWIGCAVFNYGAMNAQLKYGDTIEFADLHYVQRDEIGLIVFESCLVPPIQVFTVLFLTNFLQRGWTLRSWNTTGKRLP